MEWREGKERGGKDRVVAEAETFERRQEDVGHFGEQVGLAFGTWAGRADLDEVWLTQGRERWWSRWVGGGL